MHYKLFWKHHAKLATFARERDQTRTLGTLYPTLCEYLQTKVVRQDLWLANHYYFSHEIKMAALSPYLFKNTLSVGQVRI